MPRTSLTRLVNLCGSSVADVKARLSAYLRDSQEGPVIVTRNGKAVAVLLAVTGEDELELGTAVSWICFVVVPAGFRLHLTPENIMGNPAGFLNPAAGLVQNLPEVEVMLRSD